MLKTMLPVAALLALAACYNEASFDDDLADVGCAWTVECYPDLFADVDACKAEADTGTASDVVCTFDAAAAKDCIDAWEALACPAEGETPEYPSVCDNVYTDCTGGVDTEDTSAGE